jgi:hypothetical protein
LLPKGLGKLEYIHRQLGRSSWERSNVELRFDCGESVPHFRMLAGEGLLADAGYALHPGILGVFPGTL